MLNYISIVGAILLAIVTIRLFRRKLNTRSSMVMVMTFLISVLVVIPAVVIKFTAAEFNINHKVSTLFGKIGYAFFTAFVDEFNKYIVVIAYLYKKKEFDEPLAGIILCIMVGLGFVTGDNLIHHYLSGDIHSETWRMPMAVAMSIPVGISMGFYTGMSKYGMDTDDVNSLLYRWRGLVLATFWHGFYNFFLYMEEYKTLVPLIVIGLLILLGHLITIIFKAYKLHSRLITSRKKRAILDD